MNLTNYITKYTVRRAIFIGLPAVFAFIKVYSLVVNFLLAIGLR